VVSPFVNLYAERQWVLPRARRSAQFGGPRTQSGQFLCGGVQPREQHASVLPAEVRGGYRRVGLRYVLIGQYETLVKLLAKLEGATPPLVIDNLHIQGGLRADRRPGRPATPGLNAGLDIYGLRTNETPVAAKP